MSEVLNEYSAHTDSDKEGLHFREVFAGTPVNDFVHSGRVGDMAFQVLHSLDDVV